MSEYFAIFADVLRIATFQDRSRIRHNAFPRLGGEVDIERRHSVPGRPVEHSRRY